MKETRGGQGAFGEIGGFRQRKYGVVWTELIGHGLELDIASGWGTG